MPKPNQIYRPLFPKRWFDLDRIRAWHSPDHLLIVESRFFSEQYTRLYWADIQTILLFSLSSPAVLLAGLEAGCVLAVVAPLLLSKVPWAFAPAALFAAFYAAWRLGRPGWACQVATRTNTKQFAIPGTLVACRRVVNDLKNHAAPAQGMPPEQQLPSPLPAGSVSGSPPRRPAAPRKEPFVAMHVIAFVLGVLSPFTAFAFVPYCVFLVITWFLQQDFQFPLPVRSAAVMSQILATLQIAFWAFRNTQSPGFGSFRFEHWQFSLPRVLISLYGIAAVYSSSIEKGKPHQKSSTVLGLS